VGPKSQETCGGHVSPTVEDCVPCRREFWGWGAHLRPDGGVKWKGSVCRQRGGPRAGEELKGGLAGTGAGVDVRGGGVGSGNGSGGNGGGASRSVSQRRVGHSVGGGGERPLIQHTNHPGVETHSSWLVQQGGVGVKGANVFS